MRSKQEIEDVLLNLGVYIEEVGDDVELEFDVEEGDSFAYGYLMGKLTALRWVLGLVPGNAMVKHYDYEEFDLAQRSRPGGTEPLEEEEE